MAGAETFFSLTEEIKNHLRYLVQLGCTGTACSDKTLEILRSWDFQKIYHDIMVCRGCSMAGQGSRAVCGSGDSRAGLMFVGGVPEPGDERTGRPYSGAAGELLDRMISAMKFSRESVYITHAVKCRPPGDRPLPGDAVKACRGFLYREIEAINPAMICTLGETATRALLDISGRFSRIRGRFYKHNGIDVMPTHSPEHLLENPSAKRDAWADIQRMMKALKKCEVS